MRRLILSLFVLLVSGTAANAMCAYNDNNVPVGFLQSDKELAIYVSFSCKNEPFCGWSRMEIEAKSKKCYPNKGGYFEVYLHNSNSKKCSGNVSAHGVIKASNSHCESSGN